MNEELGYLCDGGHFRWRDDPTGVDYNSCRGKALGYIVFIPATGVQFDSQMARAVADHGEALKAAEAKWAEGWS